MERQLTSSQSKYHELEDTVLQLERGAHALERQAEQARKQLEAESAKCKQLHQVATNQKRELALDQDRLSKMDAALKKALTDQKNKEWEIKQLESRQDKKIVEHVHVLEKAKKVTDQQLKDAQEELQKNAAYIRSLEKVKLALTREAEDFVREDRMEQVQGMVAKIKAQIERQHKELLNLIMKDTPMDEAFRSRLVRELKVAEEELARQFSAVTQTSDFTKSTPGLKDESTARLEESRKALVRHSEVW